MFKILINAWKVKDIRNKLIFIMLLLVIFRLGSNIPIPGINLEMLAQARHGGTAAAATNIFAVIAGGGYGSLFAMGIGPYITASIIMQLLTYAIPPLEQMQKEGEDGRKKINQITRYVAVGLSLLQAGATVYSYSVAGLFVYANFFTYVLATVAMMSGTIFIMWLAEILTERGIGNGSSFIIFANILASLPGGVQALYLMMTGDNIVLGVLKVIGTLVVFIAIIAFVVLVQEGERRIPVQYSKKMAGRSFGNNSSFIPIKVNIAGVMSIIFALAILQFPEQINNFINNDTLGKIASYLSLQHWVGVILYVLLIFMFTFFYTSFAIYKHNGNGGKHEKKRGLYPWNTPR